MTRLVRQVRRGLAALLFPARADADLDHEVRDFVQRRTAELTREGLSDDEALRRCTTSVGTAC